MKSARVPWELLHNGGWGMFTHCPFCEQPLRNEDEIREHWVKGHFDFKDRKHKNSVGWGVPTK